MVWFLIVSEYGGGLKGGEKIGLLYRNHPAVCGEKNIKLNCKTLLDLLFFRAL